VASNWREPWRAAAKTAAERLGLQTTNHGDVTGSVEGLPVAVFVQESGTGVSTPIGTVFQVGLPGWPTTAGLDFWPGRTRFRHWPMFRSRYIRFNDPNWDKAFTVRARDPATVRLHLDQECRDLIAAHTEKVRGIGPIATGENYWLTSGEVITVRGTQSLYQIRQGLLQSSINAVVTSPDVITKVMQRMIDLAKAITR